MSSNVTEAAFEKVIETIVNKATEKAVDRILDYVVKNPDHIIEGILGVSVFVLAKLYGWSMFKMVSRVLCGWPKTREPSTERSLCVCACCGRSTPSSDVEEQREELVELRQLNQEAECPSHYSVENECPVPQEPFLKTRSERQLNTSLSQQYSFPRKVFDSRNHPTLTKSDTGQLESQQLNGHEQAERPSEYFENATEKKKEKFAVDEDSDEEGKAFDNDSDEPR